MKKLEEDFAEKNTTQVILKRFHICFDSDGVICRLIVLQLHKHVYITNIGYHNNNDSPVKFSHKYDLTKKIIVGGGD